MDAACKRLLANKSILAWILKDCVEEYRNCDIRDIVEKYIESEPQIAEVAVNPATNALMNHPGVATVLATGGSGDVLAGTVASLVSRGINETVASAMAVYIHGLAGDIAKDKYGIESVTASKVMECIPCALRQILQVEN